MKRVIIGTAGHVDHGKTSLVRALTGIDCDRLKEEKERGLTIELGFTQLTLPSGQELGVVDVPGHVRFIHHMLSGASGIDLVVLVVAADEAVMPQTVEHVQICELLGIKKGLVALTKVDLVDDDLLELAREDVAEFLDGTFLQDAPIVPVSSTSGAGLDELVAVIEQQVAEVQERQVSGIPILPVDRVFSIKGFGTVVTGTLSRGTFSEGDDVEILPAGTRAKIRVLQVHSREVNQSLAGMRTAVNLQGLTMEQVERGTWVVPADTLKPTRVVDARLKLIRKPGKGGIKLHIGTTEAIGEMSLHVVDGEDMARIRLRQPVVACQGDRFILRSLSPAQTIGGGEVLNPAPVRRFSEQIMRDLASEDPVRQVHALVDDAGMHGLSRRELLACFAGTNARVDKPVQELLSKGAIIRYDTANDYYVGAVYTQRLKERMRQAVTEFHTRNASAAGMSKEHLRSSLGFSLDTRLFHKVLSDLVRGGEFEETGPDIRQKGFNAALSGGLEDIAEQVYRILDRCGLEPPRAAEIAQEVGLTPKELGKVLGFLSHAGRLVKIKDDIYLSDTHDRELKRRISDFLTAQGTMSPANMKTVVGVSRKYAIPYMEYLDRIRFTMRVGNVRKLTPRGE